MRHRSPRPLPDIRRLRPLMAGLVRRSAELTAPVLVVGLAVVFGAAFGGVMTVSGLVEGAPRTQSAAASPAQPHSGSDVSLGGGRTSVPPSSSASQEQTPIRTPSAQTPTRTPTPAPTPAPSAAAGAPGQPAPPEASGSATPEPDGAAPPAPTGQPDSPSGTPTATAAADDISPETSAATSSSGADTWTVTFSADEPSSFECSLDDAGFESCVSTMEYTDLDPGMHTFSVRATDVDGNLDESPASLRRHPTGKE